MRKELSAQGVSVTGDDAIANHPDTKALIQKELDGIMKLFFEEYECYPECERVGSLILYNSFNYYATFTNTFFFQADLINKSKNNQEYLFDIVYQEDKFIRIVY